MLKLFLRNRLWLVATALVFQQVVALAQPNWKPVPAPLMTVWGEKIAYNNALPEYPRPNMVRDQWINLNGIWDIAMYPNGSEKPSRQGQVLVPYPVESALSGLGWAVKPDQRLVYSTKLDIPARWEGQRILLHFGAVDWHTKVYLNDQLVGEHKGGYDPFFFDLTDFLKVGSRQFLSVHVTDPTDHGGQAIGKQRLEPGGIWYTPTSGIWQTVWLEPVPKTYVKSYRVEPYIENSRIVVRVETGGDKDGQRVSARILQDGKVVSQSSGKAGTPLLLTMNNVRRWTLEDPYLYDLEISIDGSSGKPTDKVRGYFGMRKIAVAPDEKGVPRLLLNDAPVFQLGPLDQGFWPDGLYTPPSEEAMKFDLETIKSLGFNMIRKHVKVEPARWYYLCDRMGFLVWQDMPSANPTTDEEKQQFKWELKAMVDNLFNYPSIVMWVPFNEGWGQHDTEFYTEKMKEWDPTRLVNNASGWTDMRVGDVMDIHDYPGPSAPPVEAKRAAVLGEFGGLGLNVQGHQWTDQGWGYQLIQTPEALLERYEDLYRELLPLVDSAGLSAAVYTQVTDVETENNGLLTYDRKLLKMDASLVKLAHQGQMPPKPTNPSRIFYKKGAVPLQTVKPGATIEYAVEGGKKPTGWLPYTAPIVLKKNTTLACRAIWPDSTASHVQRYVFTKTKALKGKGPKSGKPGLQAKLYEGAWDKLPDFNTLTPINTLTVNALKLDSVGRSENFGLVFEGWVEVPLTGVYTFHLRSDDGSRLAISGQTVIEHDGLHGMAEKTGSVALKKGTHSIRLDFFQKQGGLGLDCWWENDLGQRLEMKLLRMEN